MEVLHARHRDTGCTRCLEGDEIYLRLRDERDKLEGLRVLYALGILDIVQALDEWARQDGRASRGFDHNETPSAEKRLESVGKVLRGLSAKGHREWQK